MIKNKVIPAFAAAMALGLAMAPVAMAESAGNMNNPNSAATSPNDAGTSAPAYNNGAVKGLGSAQEGVDVSSPTAVTSEDTGGAGATGAQSEMGSSTSEHKKMEKAEKKRKRRAADAERNGALTPKSNDPATPTNKGVPAPAGNGTQSY